MKKSYILILIVLCVFSGCGKTEIKERSNIYDNTVDSNMNDLEREKGYISSVSVGVRNEKKYYEYKGDRITIPYQYCVEGCDMKLGIMILCDGICTPFSVENKEPSIVNVISVKEKQQTDIPLSFIPKGCKGETVKVQILDIVDPMFSGEGMDNDEILRQMERGLKGRVKGISGIEVFMKCDGDTSNESKANGFMNEEFSETDKKEKDLKSFHCDSKINGKNKVLYTVNQGEKINIEVTYWGEEIQGLYTVFLVDNCVFPAFEGKKYHESQVSNKNKTLIKAVLDTSKLNKGKHICYSVCGYVDYITEPPTDAFILDVR